MISMIRRSSASSYALMAAHLLRAMGLATPIALTAAACGGIVVVDPLGEGGGGGSTTTTTTATGTGTDPCAGVPLTDGRKDVCYAAQGGSCAPPTTDAVFPHLTSEQISSSVCEELCCTTTTIVSILCGPWTEADGSCCYRTEVSVNQICEGRPFTVGGEARTAPAAARTDWQAGAAFRLGSAEAGATPDVARLPQTARSALAEAWARDGRFEHASIASFARFVLELLSAGAPPDLVADAQAALKDEIRHASLCFGLASAYACAAINVGRDSAFAGPSIGPGPLPIEDALHDRRDLPSIAAAVVREGCVGETIAALAAMEARDGAKDPAVRAALDEIAEDELRHATLSWRFAAWAARQGGAPVRAAIAAAFEEARGAATPPAALPPPDPHAALLSAHGRLSPDAERRVASRALAEVVRPAAAALLSEAGAITTTAISL
jgi:hypothetical protein